jgi:hypothetical protein
MAFTNWAALLRCHVILHKRPNFTNGRYASTDSVRRVAQFVVCCNALCSQISIALVESFSAKGAENFDEFQMGEVPAQLEV